MTMAARSDSFRATAPDPVVDALVAVGREIAALAEVSDRLQGLISAALVADGSRNADHMREFQAIDLLVQRLQGVSIFVEAMASQASPEWRMDAVGAAAKVPLSDLARRLTGDIEGPCVLRSEPGVDDGELDLF